jgi:hypothetical protein
VGTTFLSEKVFVIDILFIDDNYSRFIRILKNATARKSQGCFSKKKIPFHTTQTRPLIKNHLREKVPWIQLITQTFPIGLIAIDFSNNTNPNELPIIIRMNLPQRPTVVQVQDRGNTLTSSLIPQPSALPLPFTSPTIS